MGLLLFRQSAGTSVPAAWSHAAMLAMNRCSIAAAACLVAACGAAAPRASATAVSAVAAAAVLLAGVRLERTLTVGGTTLNLLSCGVRDTMWIDHYVTGLYVAPGGSALAARDPSAPKAVLLKIVQARFLPARIPEKWRAALQRELEREPMARVRRAYSGLADGDVVTFAYLPDDGVTMSVNGHAVIRTPGHGVIDSILDAWAEKDPISGRLQRLVFSNPC